MTISAKVIAHSVGPHGPPLVTVQCRYPKFIHGEVMTHRVFSRNASSSRAIPVERLIKDVIDDPVYPSFWGKNQPGMSAAEECYEPVEFMQGVGESREEAWAWARDDALDAARAFAKAGYHKQIVNRLLEPFSHINTLITATEWDNFFELRCHPAAQPEMRLLAEAILDAAAESKPKELEFGEWHLPYVDMEFEGLGLDAAIKVSTARCARVSYLTQEGKTPDIESDLKLYFRLVGERPLHASPAEHQATPDEGIMTLCTGLEEDSDYEVLTGWQNPTMHGNFVGWKQHRKFLEGFK